MPEHSTLLYQVDDFDLTSKPIKFPVVLNEILNDDFLNALLETLVYDPGDGIVKKVLLKTTL